MGFFGKTKDKTKNNKEKSGLPDLPELPNINPPNKTTSKIGEPPKNPSLPSFPNSTLGEKINQNTVKDAVTHEETPSIPPINPRKGGMKPSIMAHPPAPPKKIEGRSKVRSREMSWAPPKETTKTSEPLFIKLDTFEKAISSFNEVKLRMGEIETLLRNIRETKTQEERELEDWEDEIEAVKARLEQIDQEIFERLE